jgi:hypothetical protein
MGAAKAGNMRKPLCLSFWFAAAFGLRAAEAQEPSAALPSSEGIQPKRIWLRSVGDGFQRGGESFAVQFGAAAGLAAFGSEQAHDLALTSVSYGHIWGPLQGEDHWFRGNVEARLELFGGAQFSPGRAWLVGLTPHLRYLFATGTRWVPFVDGGLGVTATSIGLPDLSDVFEFNVQGGAGCHWFLRDDLALTLEARYLHISCAGLSRPNRGVNSVMAMVGLTWFF